MAKLVFQKITTETSGSLDEKNFEIGNASIVMEILRDKLYADPIVAVVREYSTNALDAMVEVGKKTQPIEITLPTDTDPFFTVKDDGPGLSPGRMDQIFRKYGNSTKRDTNEQIGAFGMGSKSGWAYSDTFSIVTRYNGIEYIYSCFLDESRTGKLVLLGESETTNVNGTSIIIPVKRKDFEAFENALTKITQYWEIKPKVFIKNGISKNEFQLEYEDEEKILSGSNWYIIKNYRGRYYSEPKVIIGGIGYPITSAPFTKLSSSLKDFIFSNNFRIHFQNGDLSLNAGRDSLHTDARTIKALTDRFDQINQEYYIYVENAVKAATTYRQAYKILAELQNSVSFKHIDISKISWEGIPLFNSLGFRDKLFENLKIMRYTRVSNKNDQIIGKSISEDNSRCSGSDWDVHPEYEKRGFFFNDLKVSNVKAYAEAIYSSYDGVWIASLEEDSSLTDEQQKILPHLFKNLSTITLPTIIKQKSTRKVAAKDKVFAYKSFNTKDIVEIDPSIGGVYYIKKDGRLTDLSKNEINCTMYEFSYIESFLGEKIFGFTQARAEALPNNWISIHTAIQNKFKEYEKKYGSIQYIFECHAAEQVKSIPNIFLRFKHKIISVLDADNCIAKYFSISKAAEKVAENTKSLIKINALCKTYPDYIDSIYPSAPAFQKINKIYLELEALDNEIRSRYPIAEHLDYYCPEKVILDYIKLIDS